MDTHKLWSSTARCSTRRGYISWHPLIPSALTDDSDVTPFGPPPWFAPPLTWSGGGHGGSDHAARPVGGRFAARGGTDAGDLVAWICQESSEIRYLREL